MAGYEESGMSQVKRSSIPVSFESEGLSLRVEDRINGKEERGGCLLLIA